jgi:hypothetical protein
MQPRSPIADQMAEDWQQQELTTPADQEGDSFHSDDVILQIKGKETK